MHDVVLRYDSAVGPVQLVCQEVSARFNVLDFFTGGMPLDNLRLESATVTLGGRDGMRILVLEEAEAALRSVDRSTAMMFFAASLNGVRVKTTGTLSNIDSLNELLSHRRKDEVLRINPTLQNTLEQAAAILHKCDFGRNDAVIESEFALDCLKPDGLIFTGDFSVSDALLSGVVVSKLRGRFDYSGSHLRLTQVLWMLGHNEQMNAEASLDLSSMRLSARLNGRLAPSTLAQLSGVERPSLRRMLTLSSPVTFEVELPESPLDCARMLPTGHVAFPELDVNGVHLTKGSFDAALRDGTLIIDKIGFGLNRKGTEYIRGSLQYELNGGRLSFDLTGRANVPRLADELGFDTPKWCARSLAQPLDFKAVLSPSDARVPASWQLSGSLRQPDVPCGHLVMSELRSDFTLREATLTLRGGTVSISDVPGTAAIFNASADVSPWLSSDSRVRTVDVKHNIHINAPKGEGTEPALEALEALDWEGVLRVGSDFKGVSLDGSGGLYIDRIVSTYVSGHGLECSDLLESFHSDGKLSRFTLKTPWITAGDAWKLEGTINASGGGFSSLKFREASCSYRITSEQTDFMDMKGTTTEGYELSLAMSIKYFPFVFSLQDIKLKGDPAIASAFIVNAEGCEVYRRIWRDVHWDASALPLVEVPTIVYRSDDMESAWTLYLEGMLAVSKARYSDVSLEDVALRLKLELPGGMSIDPIALRTGGCLMKGNCQLTFGDSPQCVFAITETDGRLEPGKLLSAINPKWENALGKLQFGDNSHLTCNGSFFMEGAPELSLSGTISSPSCKFRNLNVDGMEASWGLDNNMASWNVREANFLDGTLKTTGTYDIKSNSGNLLIIGKRMNLSKLNDFMTPDNPATTNATKTNAAKNEIIPDMPGVVDTECSIRLLHNWAGQPYHIEGTGRVAIREADLWRLPVLKQLSYLLGVTTFRLLSSKKNEESFGHISSLDADLLFLGTRVSVPNLVTNGTIIALSGEGEYSWEKDRLFFQVSGEALKEISLLSVLLKPLSWAFHAELSGTSAKHEWKLRSALRKLLPGD